MAGSHDEVDHPMARQPLAPSSDAEVRSFLARVREGRMQQASPGRLLFAMDATASREATWDRASRIQAEMFEEAARTGGLQVQLAWYWGIYGFDHSDWVTDGARLRATMEAVRCAAGATQIRRVIDLALELARKGELTAAVFIGDCMEESPETLLRRAGELRLHNVPLFIFQEGREPLAAATFQQMAKLTRGAYLPFVGSSSDDLAALLRGVAAYTAGGQAALDDLAARGSEPLALLTRQMREQRRG